MKNVDRREKIILENLDLARWEAKSAYKMFRKLRTETKDDFLSIAYLVLIDTVDSNNRNDFNNDRAWLRLKIRWGIWRYVGRTDDARHIQFRDYLIEPLPWDYSGLIDLAIKFKKQKKHRNKARCKSRLAKQAILFEFFAPEYFK